MATVLRTHARVHIPVLCSTPPWHQAQTPSAPPVPTGTGNGERGKATATTERQDRLCLGYSGTRHARKRSPFAFYWKLMSTLGMSRACRVHNFKYQNHLSTIRNCDGYTHHMNTAGFGHFELELCSLCFASCCLCFTCFHDYVCTRLRMVNHDWNM